jgi:hypothetical protein
MNDYDQLNEYDEENEALMENRGTVSAIYGKTIWIITTATTATNTTNNRTAYRIICLCKIIYLVNI